MAKALTKQHQHLIMADSLVDNRTLKKAYAGVEMNPSAHARITRAAHTLKLPAPKKLIAARVGRPRRTA